MWWNDQRLWNTKGSNAEDKSRHHDSVQSSQQRNPGQTIWFLSPDRPESTSADGNRHETSGGEASFHAEESGSQDVLMSDAEISSHVDYIKRLFIERTENYGIP